MREMRTPATPGRSGGRPTRPRGLRGPPAAALAIAAATALAAAAAGPASAPATTPPASTRPASTAPAADVSPEQQRKIGDAVAALAADDFRARERATRALWQFGGTDSPPAVRQAAAEAVRRAAASGNPEVARRARSVLRGLAFGIPPDAAQDVLDQIAAYRRADAERKRAAVAELIRMEVPGARALLKLAEDEPDPDLRRTVLAGLSFLARPSVAALAADGDLATANRLLAAVAGEGDQPARDHAAFLLVAGGLDEAVASLAREVGPATQPSTRPNPFGPLEAAMRVRRIEQGQLAGLAAARLAARKAAEGAPVAAGGPLRLAYLYRAQGDPAAGAAVADAAGDPKLADALLADAGRYAELAARAEARGVSDASVEDLGYVTAYHRLAGHQAAADRWAAKLVDHGKANPGNEAYAAAALMLNGYAARAMDLLVGQKASLVALEFAANRFDFSLADAVVAEAKAAGGPDLPRVLARTAPLLHEAGRTAEATARLRAVAAGEHGAVGLDVWRDLVEAGPASGVPTAEVDGWMARALSTGDRQPGESPETLFFRARLRDPARALGWWATLRDHRSGVTPAAAMALVRRIDRGLVAGDELKELTDKATELAGTLPVAARVNRLTLVADALADAGQAAAAVAVAEKVVALAESADTLEKLGDLNAKAERWDKAAAAYARARQADPADAKPVALEAWCLGKLGRADESARGMALAHLIPLGDESARGALANALAAHGLAADARRERELILRTGDPKTWAYAEAVRRLAADVAKTDPPAAAAMTERAFLVNHTVDRTFTDPTFNLTIPAQIQRMRAVGEARAGRPAEAAAIAAAILEACPADADAQIAVIRELDKTGHKPEADAVYRRAFDRYDALRAKHPESPQANNLVAWTLACVKRDLDHALACAKKGVELDPDNSAILDTLSEVHFARGEYDEALALNAKCRASDANDEHQKKNFARFTAAKAGKPVGDDAGGSDEGD
jgi:hypothetical protein